MVSVKPTMSEKKTVSFFLFDAISTCCRAWKIDAYTCGAKYLESFV